MQYIAIFFRVLLGLFFLGLGLLHFYYTIEMAIFVPLPTGAVPFVYFVGTLTSMCGLLIIANRYVRQSLIALAVMLCLTAAMVQIGVELQGLDPILKRVGISNVIKLLIAWGILLVLAVRRK